MALKRIFEQGSDVDPILTHRVAMGLAGNSTKNSTWQKIVTWLQTALQDATHRFVTDTEKAQWNGNLVKQKTISLGVWNMDTAPTIDVAHGMTSSKIMGFRALIYPDTPTATDRAYMLDYTSQADTGPNGGYGRIGDTFLRFERVTSGFFDSSGFSSTGSDRGLIIIDYID
jgi:hypothetical protein